MVAESHHADTSVIGNACNFKCACWRVLAILLVHCTTPQVVAGMLSGSPFSHKIQLTAGQPSDFCKGPNLFGWTADGAFANGVHLLAASATAFAAIRVAREMGGSLPSSLAEWAAGLSIITAGHTVFATPSNRVLQMWKETMINARVHQRLNPIMMAKSLSALAVKDDGRNIEQIVKQYDMQMGMRDQNMKLSKHATVRIKCFMNRSKLPLQAWTFLELAWSKTRYEESAFFDKMFDVPAFYVGAYALETYSEWWRRMLTVTPKSQMAVLVVAESHHTKHRQRLTEATFRSLCARSAFLHNALGVLLDKAAIDSKMADDVEKAFVADSESPMQADLVALLDTSSLPDVGPVDAVAWITDTCAWVRVLKWVVMWEGNVRAHPTFIPAPP